MQLVRQLAEYTISLKQLEDNLLARLAASQVGGAVCGNERGCGTRLKKSTAPVTVLAFY